MKNRTGPPWWHIIPVTDAEVATVSTSQGLLVACLTICPPVKLKLVVNLTMSNNTLTKCCSGFSSVKRRSELLSSDALDRRFLISLSLETDCPRLSYGTVSGRRYTKYSSSKNQDVFRESMAFGRS